MTSLSTSSRALRIRCGRQGLSALLAAAVLCFSACVTATTSTWREARDNQQRIDAVAMGQTTEQVRSIMGHPPERREARLRFDGKSVEEWSYVTDVVRKRDATITFLDGRVVEIRTKPWVDPD